MLIGRVLIGVAFGVAAFVAVANVRWSSVVRETQFDGGLQREYLILGKFRYAPLELDPKVEISGKVARKLQTYGLAPSSPDASGTLTIDSSRIQYWLSEETSGDIRKESARLAKAMPWLKQVWHGTRFTSFYARGFHPKKGGFVEVMYGRLPERKHGPGKLHVTISVSE